jgi:aminopeptidase
MPDPRVSKLAELLVDYSVAVKPGDKVMLNGPCTAAPLLKEIYSKVIKAGGLPFNLFQIPGTSEIFFRTANDDQLQYIPEPIRLAYETMDVNINIIAEENTKALTSVDPSRMVLRSRATAELDRTFLERAARGDLRWTLTLYPTHAHAQ